MSESCTCPWCGAANLHQPGVPNFCTRCSHRTDVAKYKCDCLMCEPFDVALLGLPEVPPTLDAVPDLTLAPPVPNTDSIIGAEEGPHDGLQVDGRFFRSPVVQVSVLESRVVLRIDDTRDPEQWLEVVISEETLAAWVQQQREAQEAEDDAQADFE